MIQRITKWWTRHMVRRMILKSWQVRVYEDIRLIIDVAMNHSSSQHPWFTQACEYLAGLKAGKLDDTVCPYVDYYHFYKAGGSNR